MLKKIIEDRHSILVIFATDIVNILRRNSISSENIDEWLDFIR